VEVAAVTGQYISFTGFKELSSPVSPDQGGRGLELLSSIFGHFEPGVCSEHKPEVRDGINWRTLAGCGLSELAISGS
jgi:hypothetical protein